MTLADLFTTLVTRRALHPGRVNNIKTSLGYLASALGRTSPDQCPVDETCRDAETWLPAIETHFATLTAQGKTISAKTRSNTRNNLRAFFRAAAAQGLLAAPLPVPLLTPPRRDVFVRQQRETFPYQETYRPTTGPRHYRLPLREWPPDIQAGWQDYQTRCDGHIRETTFQNYAKFLALYLGYLLRVAGKEPRWEDVFDPAPLRVFVRWQAARVGRASSACGHHVVAAAATIAKVVGHPHAKALADLRRTLRKPARMHIKRHHWVTLAELDAVADACLREGRRPVLDHTSLHPGARRASQFQKGVMLKLLVRVPLRQRNVREMQLDKNLYQERQTGHWYLNFEGDELKVDARRGQVNKYKLNLSEHTDGLLPVLKEWREEYRPKLPGATASKFLFLTNTGRPFTDRTLHRELAETVAMHTGQRFYPHLIRTIWATEYLKNRETYGDFQGAATMLGDTPQMVMAAYNDVLEEEQHAKAKDFLALALKRPAPASDEEVA
jgi:integrase